MKSLASSVWLVLFFFTSSTLAGARYRLKDNIVGERFYSAFNFEAIPDPTNGRVNYVDEVTARNLNLTYATSDTFIMRADNTTVLSPSGPGRNSIRIRSNNKYTTHVAVFDMSHMPQGCGTWPAVWETDEPNWPNGGEIDVVEGVNDVVPNHSTLHTSPNCSIPASGAKQLGTTVTTNCDASVNSNSGCGVKMTQNNNTFGPAFNGIGGGRYALERTESYINIWFWERCDPSVPLDMTCGSPMIDTSNWGTPAAHFPNTDCNLKTHFDAHHIIINLTFCGDWAGNSYVYTNSGCPSNCIDYVNNNPAAFTDAYFQFASINIYERYHATGQCRSGV